MEILKKNKKVAKKKRKEVSIDLFTNAALR
jgi:hypothetical protein